MKPEEYYSFEDRTYVSPTLSRDEQLSFINNLRDTQEKTNQQIENETYALGSKVATSQGGLTSGATNPDSYFMSRYQTPQIDAQVANLKASAQASALNDTLKNLSEQYKKRYNDAYQAAQKRAREKAKKALSSVGGGGEEFVQDLTINTNTNSPDSLDVNINPNTGENSLVPVGKNMYTYQGKTLSPAPTSFMSMSNQGLSLGVWPNGTKLTEGSTYSAGGNTYTYVKADNTPTPNIYKIVN